MPWSLSQVATCATFLSCGPARQDLVADHDQRGGPDACSSNSVRTSKPCPSASRKEQSFDAQGERLGWTHLAYMAAMTQYITVAADDRVEARNGVIKLHGAEASRACARAGRLAAEILDALVPHVVPGVSTAGARRPRLPDDGRGRRASPRRSAIAATPRAAASRSTMSSATASRATRRSRTATSSTST